MELNISTQTENYIEDSGDADESIASDKRYSLVDVANAMIEYDFKKIGVRKELPESGGGQYNNYTKYETKYTEDQNGVPLVMGIYVPPDQMKYDEPDDYIYIVLVNTPEVGAKLIQEAMEVVEEHGYEDKALEEHEDF